MNRADVLSVVGSRSVFFLLRLSFSVFADPDRGAKGGT